eukprot:2020745-Pyramimonas_sp.AAC.1
MALPSRPSAGNVISAGVAVFARSQWGVRTPQVGLHQVREHRVQHAQLDLPGWPTLHLVNMYMHPSLDPLGENVKLLAAAGAAVESVEVPCMLEETGICHQFCSFVGLTLVPTQLYTCRGGS